MQARNRTRVANVVKDFVGAHPMEPRLAGTEGVRVNGRVGKVSTVVAICFVCCGLPYSRGGVYVYTVCSDGHCTSVQHLILI